MSEIVAGHPAQLFQSRGLDIARSMSESPGFEANLRTLVLGGDLQYLVDTTFDDMWAMTKSPYPMATCFLELY